MNVKAIANPWAGLASLILGMVVAASFGMSATVQAQDNDPTEVVLTVVSAQEPTKVHHFTRSDLDRLPQHEITTKTPWTPGSNTFSGPSLADVLAAAAIPGPAINLVAIDDYAMQMPRSDLMAEVPIIADRLDGKPFGVAAKGPLWVMYPFSEQEYQTEVFYGRSVWQLSRIEVGAE